MSSTGEESAIANMSIRPMRMTTMMPIGSDQAFAKLPVGEISAVTTTTLLVSNLARVVYNIWMTLTTWVSSERQI